MKVAHPHPDPALSSHGDPLAVGWPDPPAVMRCDLCGLPLRVGQKVRAMDYRQDTFAHHKCAVLQGFVR